MAYINFQLKHQVVKAKKSSVKVLLLLFLNCSLWLAGSFLFIHLEGSTEAEHKCGVKRVQRDFIDALWSESQQAEEGEWKSLARRRLAVFEEQLHEAVEAGVSSYSGRKVWSLSSAMVYCFTLATTIGYGHLTPSAPGVRLVSLCYGGLACPLLVLLVAEVAALLSALVALAALGLRSRREQSREEEDVMPLDLLVSEQGPSTSLLLATLLSYSLAGACLYSNLYMWDLPSSFYFVLSSLSTVGFGDISPEDPVAFLMTVGYILLGLAIYSLWQEAVVGRMEQGLDSVLARLGPRRPEKAHVQ